MEIWKKVESFEKIWQFRNFTKKIEILINFLSLEKNLEIWKRFWNLENILKFGKNWEFEKKIGNMEEFGNSEKKTWNFIKNLETRKKNENSE